ncbi:3-hydroxyacyl-CoA dehydrogenase NAD-binding domain-containing protein, partial [Georgenia sp.]
ALNGERVTVLTSADVAVAGLGTVVVLTLAPEDGTDRPCSLGPVGLGNVEAGVRRVAERARAGEVDAVVLTGSGRTFLAGADLQKVRTVRTLEEGIELARHGHRIVAALADLPVPTLAHLGGAALGGGLELALACDYRSATADVRAIGLPETHLGLLPGWGGCTTLPRLLGPDAALRLIIDDPTHGNRLLTAGEALAIGLVDVVLPAAAPRTPAATPTPRDAGVAAPDGAPSLAPGVADALAWLRDVVAGTVAVARRVPAPARDTPDDPATDEEWRTAVDARHALVTAATAGGAPAPALALKTVAASRTRSRAAAYALEDEGLAHLIMSDPLRATLYALDLMSHRAKNPAGRPPGVQPRPIHAVGVVGAGLMAGQLALLFARSLDVPVTMRDLDDERARRGLAAVHEDIDRQAARGRITEPDAARLRERIRVTTELSDLADADLVIEAVFEELTVKQQVFAELERVVSAHAVLATNTSALSVTAMAAGLAHPERVVGLHFFNPVARLPLVEVVRAGHTDDVAYATAFAVAAVCRKNAVAVADAPGFVVNRVLIRLLGEVLGALEEGTTVAAADRALVPLGLPMGPFQLLQLVGPAVALHVLQSLRADLGERYPDSPGLAGAVATGRSFVLARGRPNATSPVDPTIGDLFGSRPVAEPLDAEGVLERVRHALAEEIDLLLAEGVVPDVRDVDLAMLSGAGWPPHHGGISPYLDRTGVSVEATGRRFLPPGVADAATT